MPSSGPASRAGALTTAVRGPMGSLCARRAVPARRAGAGGNSGACAGISAAAVPFRGRADGWHTPGMPDFAFDMLVIGSGPGGQKAAIAAAKLGRRVAVVDRAD